jgi:hypothetical protein
MPDCWLFGIVATLIGVFVTRMMIKYWEKR